jgi:CubicO group peptidase (beta-lactamase class C family)
VAATFADEARAANVPGAVLGIVENGELAYAVGVGREDPRGDLRMGPNTLFRVGSVTKMMTALAVLQEVEAGWPGWWRRRPPAR